MKETDPKIVADLLRTVDDLVHKKGLGAAEIQRYFELCDPPRTFQIGFIESLVRQVKK